jgi:hypothetical protein
LFSVAEFIFPDQQNVTRFSEFRGVLLSELFSGYGNVASSNNWHKHIALLPVPLVWLLNTFLQSTPTYIVFHTSATVQIPLNYIVVNRSVTSK